MADRLRPGSWGQPRDTPGATGASFRELAEGGDADALPGRGVDGVPPPIERLAAPGEPYVHTFGKPDPGSETLFRHRDEHGNVGVERLRHEIDQPPAFGFRAAEPIDDDEIGAVLDRSCEPHRKAREPIAGKRSGCAVAVVFPPYHHHEF